MISITKNIQIDENELKFEFTRSSGPGGQNVNKVSTAVHMTFNTLSPSLPGDVRKRLLDLAGNKVDTGGILHINASKFRTQHMNRQDAVERFTELLKKAAVRPKTRIRTRPPASSVTKMKEAKEHRSKLKELRKPVRF